jgi:ligand-binding SRPBCC domain-containing protein
MFEHTFEAETTVPAPLDEVFPFFSDAANLGRVTPPSVGFQILSPQPVVMREGAVIDYSIRLHGFPMRWRTRIARWNPPHEFIDEQLKGPYRIWVHHHTFTETPDGRTLMRDHVHYALPLPPFGQIALPWVRAEIKCIFAYRQKVILEMFPEK